MFNRELSRCGTVHKRHCLTMVVAILACVVATPRPASATETYRLSAKRVAFYTNTFILQGSGNVQVDIGGERQISADFFSMDVRGNRFVVAGNVHLRGPDVDDSFAALSVDLVAQRAYAIVANSAVERWAFSQNDFAHPQRDAQVPPDAFELPLITFPASKLGHKIIIGARSYIRYGSCVTQFIGGAGVYVPIPSCYVNAGDDPALAQSALAAANAGGEINLTGSANAVSGLFLIYDRVNGFYTALQENVASANAWAVFALTASGHPGLSVIGALTPSDAFGVRVSTTVQSLAPTATSSITGFRYSDVRVSQALGPGYAELFASTAADSGTGSQFFPSQPSSAQFDFATPNEPIGSFAFGTMRIGYGELHDTFGLQQLGPTNYTTLGFGYLNAALSAPAIPIGGTDPRRRFELGLLAGQAIQRFSIPHETAITTTAATLTKALGSSTVSLGYSIANVADRYADQQLAYPSFAGGFDGLATFRTLTLGATAEASPQLTTSFTLHVHDDFPKPAQGLFPVVDAAPLGQNPYPYQLGEPPADVTLAVRLRLNPQLSLDITDTQFINARGWPTNTFQFLLTP
jgi:hypothetical protein